MALRRSGSAQVRLARVELPPAPAILALSFQLCAAPPLPPAARLGSRTLLSVPYSPKSARSSGKLRLGAKHTAGETDTEVEEAAEKEEGAQEHEGEVEPNSELVQ